MNFRDLVTRLDLIENAGLTLATVKSAEDAARDKAATEKTKGGWTGFTSWDPKTAGNIAVALIAQQNKLEGLFNSDGDFVVAYGDNEWSSKQGQSPRVAPPTPADWKPLASLGLIPDNAKGPAGLTDWLTGGKSKQEFDAVKQQSAGVRQAAIQTVDQQPSAVTSPVVAPTNLTSTPLSPVSSEVPASKSLDPGEELVPNNSNIAPSEKAQEVDDLLNQYLSMNNDNSKEDQVVTEGMYKSLVESFGYNANEGWRDAVGKGVADILTTPKGLAGLGATVGAVSVERTSPKEGMFGYKWDADIIPGVPYTLRDAVIDAGIAAGSMAIGAIGGPPGEMAALAANAGRIKKLISVVKAVGGKLVDNGVPVVAGQGLFNVSQDIAHTVKNMYMSKDDCDIQMPDQPPVKNPC